MLLVITCLIGGCFGALSASMVPKLDWKFWTLQLLFQLFGLFSYLNGDL